MELALNVFWFLLALTSVGLWWRHGSRFGLGHPARRNGLIALCCALFILFPAISMTDDLHAEMLVMEEANFSRRTLRGSGHHARSVASDLQGPALLAACNVLLEAFAFRFIIVGTVAPAQVPSYAGFLVRPSLGRAPPPALHLS